MVNEEEIAIHMLHVLTSEWGCKVASIHFKVYWKEGSWKQKGRQRERERGWKRALQGMVAERGRKKEREAAIETVLRSLGSHGKGGWRTCIAGWSREIGRRGRGWGGGRRQGWTWWKRRRRRGSHGRGSSGREITATPILLQPARRLPISLRGAPVLS